MQSSGPGPGFRPAGPTVPARAMLVRITDVALSGDVELGRLIPTPTLRYHSYLITVNYFAMSKI